MYTPQKNVRFFALIFLTASFSGSLGFAENELSVPKTVETGQLRGNAFRTFRFVIKNISTEELEITGILTSCTCTDVQIRGGTVLASSEEREVHGSVNFGAAPGLFETKVILAFRPRNGREQKTVVPVCGKVVADLILQTSIVDFGEIDVAQGIRSMTIETQRGNSGDTWDSIKPECESKSVSAIAEILPEGRSRINVQLDPRTLPIGQFRSSLNLHLAQNGKRVGVPTALTVTAKVKGPLTATPGFVYLSAMNANALVEKFVDVSSSTLDLRTLTVEKSGSAITVQMTENGEHSVRLSIAIKAPDAPGAFNDKVIVSHPSSGTALQIRILGVVQDQGDKTVQKIDGSTTGNNPSSTIHNTNPQLQMGNARGHTAGAREYILPDTEPKQATKQ